MTLPRFRYKGKLYERYVDPTTGDECDPGAQQRIRRTLDVEALESLAHIDAHPPSPAEFNKSGEEAYYSDAYGLHPNLWIMLSDYRGHWQEELDRYLEAVRPRLRR